MLRSGFEWVPSPSQECVDALLSAKLMELVMEEADNRYPVQDKAVAWVEPEYTARKGHLTRWAVARGYVKIGHILNINDVLYVEKPEGPLMKIVQAPTTRCLRILTLHQSKIVGMENFYRCCAKEIK